MNLNIKRAAAIAAAALLLPFFATSALAIGAIAVDDEQGQDDPGYGFVTGYKSEATAKAAALRECRKSGNESCKVMGWFKNCGAYAASKKYYGYGYGKTQAVATAAALEMCGNKRCKVVVSECE